MAFTILHPAPGRIRGVLFDMDGVILDSEKLYVKFWMEACALFGHSMNYPQALGMRSLNAEAGQRYLSGLFGPEISYSVVREKRIALMDTYVAKHGIAPKPGIYELLDYLQEQGIPYAITTASPIDRVQEHLGRVVLLLRFPILCSARQVPHGKPEPDIYLFGAKNLNLPPESCLALEDSQAGILSAHRAGCKATIVPDLDQPNESTLAIAYAKADSLTDVIELIKTHNGKS